MAGDDPTPLPWPWAPALPGPEPVPLSFPFAQAQVAADHLEGLLERLDAVLDRHRDLLEHALVDFEGRSADAFRARTDLLLRQWVVERDRVARELQSVEEQVATARQRIGAREAARDAWRRRRDAWAEFGGTG